MLLEEDVVNKYLGTKYANHGRDMSGLDCWGLILAVYKDMGYSLIDLETYEREWAKNGGNYFLDNYAQGWDQVTFPWMFDVALFQNHVGIACHAGLVLSDRYILHATDKFGVVKTPIDKYAKAQKLCGYFHLKERRGNDNQV